MPTDTAQSDASGLGAPGTEPLACVSCRARKLKCDRVKPACGRCLKVSNECVYPESRRKPTFKRRNVKELEARLAQVEDYLREVNRPPEDKAETGQGDMQFDGLQFDPDTSDAAPAPPNVGNVPDHSQLMGLGITESLPPHETMEELNNIFFQSQYHFMPLVHPGRYLQAFNGSPLRKPPMCLQYGIWAMASLGHDKYGQYQDIFYRRARQYADTDEMKGRGEHFITLGHAQAWALISSFEAKNMLFTRAAMSSARCVRLVHMMGLDRLDGDPDDIPPALAPALTWAEVEERRRVFWGAFAIDSHASISTGWPNLINSDDITTRLPASEAAFLSNQKEEAPFLEDVFRGSTFAGFASTVVTCQIFKTILRHVHRSKPQDQPGDVPNGLFWRRHRDLDNKLSVIFMFLPEKLRLPQNARDPSATHLNLNLHASVICLHHAAIEKADKYSLAETVKQTSVYRLKTSAEEIAGIIKLTAHSTACYKSPLCALSLYCATTVYVYLAKQDPINGLTSADLVNLEMIIKAMEAIGRNHSITRAFLQQACLDVERNGLASSIRMPALSKYRDLFGGASSNIPLLARSQVAKHTELSPVLPGRLPLDGPKGVRLSNPWNAPGDSIHPRATGSDGVARSMLGEDCFHPVLGAVTRNVSGSIRQEELGHKRKRMSPSPGLDTRNEFTAPPHTNAPGGGFFVLGQDSTMKPTLLQGGGWQPGDIGIHQHKAQAHVVLPDRTNSSSSSPGNRGGGPDTVSGSGDTSPMFGLGNTAEENRIDLRALQDGISTPIWQATEETFLAQFADTIVADDVLNAAFGRDGVDSWSTLTGDVDWGTG